MAEDKLEELKVENQEEQGENSMVEETTPPQEMRVGDVPTTDKTPT